MGIEGLPTTMTLLRPAISWGGGIGTLKNSHEIRGPNSAQNPIQATFSFQWPGTPHPDVGPLWHGLGTTDGLVWDGLIEGLVSIRYYFVHIII